jgi:monoamine oxidase
VAGAISAKAQGVAYAAAISAAALGGPLAAFAAPAPGIAVIGGGIAGLNAALTLRDAGIASTVYEASGRVGGRMHSDTTSWLNGQTSEHCGELIDSRHKTILGLANRFNIPRVDLTASEPVQSTETDFFAGSYYIQAQANADFKTVWNNLKADLNSARFPTVYNSYTNAGYALDHLSLSDWIETRVPGGHGSNLGKLLDVAYNIEYGNVTTEQSSLNLVYLLGFQPVPGDFRVFGASDGRYHLVGGNEQLPRAIAAALPSGSVQLDTALSGIVRNSDGTYTLTLTRAGVTFTTVADRVIMAIPFSVLRNILTSDAAYRAAGFTVLKQTAVTQLGCGKNAKLQLQFDGRLWNQAGPWGISTGTTYADTGYQNTWDATRGQDGATGILVDYTGGGVPLASFTGSTTDPGWSPSSPRPSSPSWSRSSPASPATGTGGRRSTCPSPTPSPSVPTPTGRWASTRSSAVTRGPVSPTPRPANAISPASVARSTSRASWKAGRRRERERPTRSWRTTKRTSFPSR